MAGDVKHARELIAEAEWRSGLDPNAAKPETVFAEMSDAEVFEALASVLEAALPGDDDWEYSVAYPLETSFGLQWDNDGLGWFSQEEAESYFDDHNGSWFEGDRVVRRRKAGRPEPVEEVGP